MLNVKSTTLLLMLFLLFSKEFYAQSSFVDHFSSLSIQVDTNTFNFEEDKINVQGIWKLPFEFRNTSPVALIKMTPTGDDPLNEIYELLPSRDYTMMDSLTLRVEGHYQCKIRFNNLLNDQFVGLKLRHKGAVLEIPFLPFTHTYATIYPGNTELYIGEEKKFELISDQIDNIVPHPLWVKKDNYEFRSYQSEGKIYVSILPTKSGQIEFELPVELYRPTIESNELTYQLPTQKFKFQVKGSRLKFLQFDDKQVIWEHGNKNGIELQIDSHRSLEMNKTYRVEDTDEKGGPLIAELFTVRRLSNDKVLCMFRPYNFHRISDGYLFIKDGDQAKFITNINILPEPEIKKVSILREGGTWINSRQIYPGETVEVRLEGEGLSRAKFRFEDLIDMSTDSILQNDVISHYLLKVPIDIRKKSINIFNGNSKTGITLDIQEYKKPRKLDFVIIEYGGIPVIASEVGQPILHNGTIGDVNLTFDAEHIDEAFKLYGKQYLELEVRIKDENNRLIEKQIIDDIVICPGSNSPRSFSYTSPDGCMNSEISINDYLSNKTHSLDNWSTVELILKHRKNVYGGRGYTERIEIIKERQVTFDVDLSIPAGLIIKKVGVPGFPGLSGISLSMLAQFSFYKKGEIQKLRPYKVGAGFLAKNAFNFNPDAERDLGIVILGSVYPTKKNRKFSFPLYAGMGYFLNEDKFFYLIGPGVRINF
tara:strand:- start:168886 stop:171003 length:2118 start_codon:yes stop_codon:yes gene_type:complete